MSPWDDEAKHHLSEGEPPMRKRLVMSALAVFIAAIATVGGNVTTAGAEVSPARSSFDYLCC
jgi:hypothetical protein